MALNMQPNIIAGILSRRTGRPDQVAVHRREDFCGAGMDNARYQVKVGFKNDGDDNGGRRDILVCEKEGIPILDHFIENTQVAHIVQEYNGAVLQHHAPAGAIRCEQNSNAFCLSARVEPRGRGTRMDPTEVALINDGPRGVPWPSLADLKSELWVFEQGQP